MNDDISIQFNDVSKRFELAADKPLTFLDQIISMFSRKRSHRRPLWAVKDLSFELSQGQCLGIVGRNGSGKSTILKLATGILRPNAGTIEARGRVSALLELGAGFHPDLTGHENIYLNGSILGLTREDIDEAYQTIVDFSEIGEFLHMPVKHYSSGMYMRLGFSVAAHVNPDVLIIDEILAVGDQSFQAKCVERISSLREQECAILIVSHTLNTIRDLCSHVLWVDRGRLVGSGRTEEMLDLYLESYEGEDGAMHTIDQPSSKSSPGKLAL